MTTQTTAAAGLRERMVDARICARDRTRRTGEDVPEVRDRVWPDAGETDTEPAGPAYAGRASATTATGGDDE